MRRQRPPFRPRGPKPRRPPTPRRSPRGKWAASRRLTFRSRRSLSESRERRGAAAAERAWKERWQERWKERWKERVDVRETCLLVRWWLPLGWHFHLEWLVRGDTFRWKLEGALSDLSLFTFRFGCFGKKLLEVPPRCALQRQIPGPRARAPRRPEPGAARGNDGKKKVAHKTHTSHQKKRNAHETRWGRASARASHLLTLASPILAITACYIRLTGVLATQSATGRTPLRPHSHSSRGPLMSLRGSGSPWPRPLPP